MARDFCPAELHYGVIIRVETLRRPSPVSLLGALVLSALVLAPWLGCSGRDSGSPAPVATGANSAETPGSAATGGQAPERSPAKAKPAEDELAHWHYTIMPGGDMRSLTARVCFADKLPERFDAQMPAARWSLTDARRDSDGAVLEQSVSGLDISSLQPGDCIVYSVDLDRVASKLESERRMRKIDSDWYISPDYWLWKPIGGREQALLTATIEAPPGVSLGVPWPYYRRASGTSHGLQNDIYRIPETTFKWLVPGALGDFDIDLIDVGETRLRVLRLGDKWGVGTERLRQWIKDAAGAVALLGGRMPLNAIQVIILPSHGKGIGYGFATQGGGGSVVLYVGRDVTEANLRKDWVAVHELLHLGMPMLDDESKWLAEGLSTYYEPFLQAKAGLQTPASVWEQMYDGFARGRKQQSERTLRAECASIRENYAFQRVYWGGAAIALLADVAARRNGSSLDAEILAIRECCLDALEILAADDLLARKRPDGTLMTPHLSATAAPYVDSVGFPETDELFRELGLSFDKKGRVTMSSDPEERALREQLTGPERSASQGSKSGAVGE